MLTWLIILLIVLSLCNYGGGRYLGYSSSPIYGPSFLGIVILVVLLYILTGSHL